ncbi:MAG: radical SAM protein [Dehalococcoidia bacterium]
MTQGLLLEASTPYRAEPVVMPSGVTLADARTILTPANGFIRKYRYSLNPYSGCRFACAYCYARFFAPTPEKRERWGEWAVAKQNAAALVERAVRRGELEDGDAIYMSSATDPYQPAEHRLGITRAILEAMLASGVQPRLTVQTRSPIVTRDIDLLRRFEHLRVNITVSTDSEQVRLRYEPHAPAIRARLDAARQLADAGIAIGISVSPMLPIADIESFARTIATLDAAEYVSQFMAPPGPLYATGTRVETLELARADGWGADEYADARKVIQRALGPGRRLLEGREGFAPPG